MSCLFDSMYSLLRQHGIYFKDVIDTETEQMISTKFDFEKNIKEEDIQNERFDVINYIDNKFVNILKFEDYHFQKAN